MLIFDWLGEIAELQKGLIVPDLASSKYASFRGFKNVVENRGIFINFNLSKNMIFTPPRRNYFLHVNKYPLPTQLLKKNLECL